LVDFHTKQYTPATTTLVISGVVTDEVVRQLEENFGKLRFNAAAKRDQLAAPQTHSDLKHILAKEDAIQSAIRMGCVLFNKTHADYHGMQVLNTVLGGYFGSRLMANIREDKGYTYGIGSGLVSLYDSGYFVISTEVGVDVTDATLKEIAHEIDRLQQDLVSDDELDRVRNYMTGVFLRSTDGPFALADRLKGLLGYSLDYSYYQNFLRTIHSITPDEIRSLAQRYLDRKQLIELVAGRKSN
jgi:predicted Zn-dependent peptidase